ncbi:MAG: Trm112 family protein [Actinobacteria bacterium]|nr:Trm112 family protein [Actinomycetota bacterium]
MINKGLLGKLACTKCKGYLQLKEKRLICLKCRKYYLIKEGIPIMLIEEARDLKEDFDGN